MNTLTIPLFPEGASVDVLLGLTGAHVHQIRRTGQPIPQPVAVRGLIDSGAEVTCADPAITNILARAGVALNRFVFANTPAGGGPTVAPEYLVSLTIIHPSGEPVANFVLAEHPILDQNLAQLGYQVLIGRDVLDKCLFLYDGPGRKFTLAY